MQWKSFLFFSGRPAQKLCHLPHVQNDCSGWGYCWVVEYKFSMLPKAKIQFKTHIKTISVLWWNKVEKWTSGTQKKAVQKAASSSYQEL